MIAIANHKKGRLSLIADLILGKFNSYADIYNPNRFTPISSCLRFVMENTAVLFDYIKGYVAYFFSYQKEKIRIGEGKIIKLNGKRMAAYRDENGKLHLVSAICTHMSCIVKWNDAERSWDCPCHGSRFTIDGDIIEGPALMPLEQFNVNSEDKD